MLFFKINFQFLYIKVSYFYYLFEPRHEISNNVVLVYAQFDQSLC